MRCPICGTNNENEALECAACGHIFVEQKDEAKKDTDITWVKDIDFTAGIDWNDDIAKPDIQQILTEKSNFNRDTKEEKRVEQEKKITYGEVTEEKSSEVLQRVILEEAKKEQLEKQRKEQEIKRQEQLELQEKERIAYQKEERRRQVERERINKQRQEKLRQELMQKEQTQKAGVPREEEQENDSEFEEKEAEFENSYSRFTKWLLIAVGACVIAAIIAVIVLATKGIKKDQVTYYQPSDIVEESVLGTEKEQTDIQSTQSTSLEEEIESTVETETQLESSTLASEFVTMGFYDLIIKNGEAYIAKYNGNESIVKIPSTYNKTPIRYIKADAFKGCTFISQIEVPEGIISIGEDAFYGCSGLSVVALPNSLENIGEGAFNYCSAFTIICNKNTFAQAFSDKYHVPTIEGSKLP